MGMTGAQNGRAAPLWVRGGLLIGALLTALILWVSNSYLTRQFSEAQSNDAILRATLYAGNIQSTLQRHSVIPMLLARDPVLIAALESGKFVEAGQRLAAFREEIGAGAVLLLDAEGRTVAASDDRPLGGTEARRAYFDLAMADTGTVFSVVENPDGPHSFHYARKIEMDGRVLGVIVVTVDLTLIEESWRRARVRVVVTNAEEVVLLASNPTWRRLSLSNLLDLGPGPSPMSLAIQSPPGVMAGDPYVYIGGVPHLSAEVPVGFRNWRLTYFATLEDVRARVNAILAMILMGMALLMALTFYLISRRAKAESRRIRRESEELRVLNARLSREIAARQRVERNLKDAEQSLEQASKLAALGQMSAAVSHELNQPLAAMKTYLAGARLLLERNRPQEALSSFQRIDDLIQRMGGITRQLKSYARKGDKDFGPVDMREVVRSSLAMMAPQLGQMAVTITSTLPSGPAMVLGDQLRLEQILVNLLRNACDAVQGQRDRQISVFLVAGDSVLLSVRDNGHGIEDPDKLFEPFHTSKAPGKGLGLGLAISAGFANEMGGRLVARNAHEGGAVFELVLPAMQAGLQQAAE